jgi:hypothetical protein
VALVLLAAALGLTFGAPVHARHDAGADPAIGRSLFNLAVLEFNDGSYQAAELLYQEAVSRMRRTYGPLNNDVVYATGAMGRNHYLLGRTAEAEKNLPGSAGSSSCSWWTSAAGRRRSRSRCGCWPFRTACRTPLRGRRRTARHHI